MCSFRFLHFFACCGWGVAEVPLVVVCISGQAERLTTQTLSYIRRYVLDPLDAYSILVAPRKPGTEEQIILDKVVNSMEGRDTRPLAVHMPLDLTVEDMRRLVDKQLVPS